MPQGKELGIAPVTTVRVTEEDIREGIRRNQYQCAIACAIQRQYPRAMRIRVNKKHIAFTIGETRYFYQTPEVAKEAIIEPFDTGKDPEPVLLRLDAGILKEVVHQYDPVTRNADRKYRRAHPKKRPHMLSSYGRIVPEEGTGNA